MLPTPVSKKDPPPVEKICTGCKVSKLLFDFDPSKRSKDLHKSKCKDCYAKEKEISECDCEMCNDNKLFDAAASIMQIVTNKILDGVEVSDDFKYIIGELALASKVVKCVKPGCHDCKEHDRHN
jgi:hypothetical protein